MNFSKNKSTQATGAGEQTSFEREERELAEVLGTFRQSVHAWSDAEFNRERKILPVRKPLFGFRLVLASSLLMIAAGVTGGITVYQHYHDIAIIQAQKDADKKRQDDEKARLDKMNQDQMAGRSNDDALLADIDSDIAQESPAAMEPLASLMAR
jgi:hypothetical protein